MSRVSKWTPTTNLMMLRRMGKLSEELGELQAVAARVIIQGIDEIDPGTGKVNRQRLEDEIADVLAQCNVTIRSLRLNHDRIHNRASDKACQMAEWEALFDGDTTAPQVTANDVFLAVQHGDEHHRAWLKEALDCVFAGQPVPGVRP